MVFQDAGNSKIKSLSINILGTGSNGLYIKRGLSNGENNSGIFVIKPNVYETNGNMRNNKTMYELSQEGYIVFE